ncbi:MAG: hypothetical protein RIQ89_247 [Bacteroidota bacterium]|jgi:tetraacyldisaccharide 4'-kinase
MQFLKKLLLPFAWLYGLAIGIRNMLYNTGFIKSRVFPIPIISVGNLTTGGTGKTPHIEYLIRLLQGEFKIATLSRGYKRKTSGYILATAQHNVSDIGDEPMQYLNKFKNIKVAVAEKRVIGIEQLMHQSDKPEVVLLDDAYQHRSVKPGLNICLLDFDGLDLENDLIPAGTLREPNQNISRADIVIVSKSPEILVPIERRRAIEKIKLLPHQTLYFSYLKYNELIRLNAENSLIHFGLDYYVEKRFTLLLVTGIANPTGLIAYLRRLTDKLEIITYGDHHPFTIADVSDIKAKFETIAGQNKIIITTEKDAMRLMHAELGAVVSSLPFFYLPITIAFHHNEKEKFDQTIINYVRKDIANNRLHRTTSKHST